MLEQGSYRLLGRTSVDIIKTGGFKVSALEIEEVLRTHPAIAECAVVGVSDAEWGERVSAAVELRQRRVALARRAAAWAKAQLAPYKVPRALQAVAALPRNAMGKVRQAGGCRALQIAITSGHEPPAPPRCRRPLLAGRTASPRPVRVAHAQRYFREGSFAAR